jgi:hypothetical protein
MKSKFLAIVLLSIAVPLGLFAASKNSANVTFSVPVSVAGKSIPAGDYKVEWQGDGAAVQVSFLQGKNIVVTAPATLVEQKSDYDGAVETKEGADNSSLLEGIDWKNRSLVFQAAEAGSVSTTGAASSAN